jgi:hypothetical protein
MWRGCEQTTRRSSRSILAASWCWPAGFELSIRCWLGIAKLKVRPSLRRRRRERRSRVPFKVTVARCHRDVVLIGVFSLFLFGGYTVVPARRHENTPEHDVHCLRLGFLLFVCVFDFFLSSIDWTSWINPTSKNETVHFAVQIFWGNEFHIQYQ